LKAADVEDGVLRGATAYLSQTQLLGKLLSARKRAPTAGAPIRVPVAVSCRVLKLDRQHYDAWVARPVTDAGFDVAERTAWRSCRDSGWWSVFSKPMTPRRGQVAAPARDDLVRRQLPCHGPKRVRLTDVTEHRTSEGKFYLCAIKAVWSSGSGLLDQRPDGVADYRQALESAVARRPERRRPAMCAPQRLRRSR